MKRALIAGLVTVLVALAAPRLSTIVSGRNDDVRDIHLVARDMTFYVDGSSDPNPTIVLRAGEQVRLHVRNDEAGMRHDFTIKAWSVGSRVLEDKGEEDAVTFRVPAQKGETKYACTPHSKMMNGTVRVE